MAQRFTDIKPSLKDFIERQQIFSVGTAAGDGRVNVSDGHGFAARGGPNRVVWLNVTGSGNESAAKQDCVNTGASATV